MILFSDLGFGIIFKRHGHHATKRCMCRGHALGVRRTFEAQIWRSEFLPSSWLLGSLSWQAYRQLMPTAVEVDALQALQKWEWFTSIHSAKTWSKIARIPTWFRPFCIRCRCGSAAEIPAPADSHGAEPALRLVSGRWRLGTCVPWSISAG